MKLKIFSSEVSKKLSSWKNGQWFEKIHPEERLISGRKTTYHHDGNEIMMMDAVKKRSTARRGFVPVFVGEDRVRYDIPVEYMNSFKFKNFLEQHREDILYTTDDPMCLLCSTLVFESVLNLAKAEIKRRRFIS